MTESDGQGVNTGVNDTLSSFGDSFNLGRGGVGSSLYDRLATSGNDNDDDNYNGGGFMSYNPTKSNNRNGGYNRGDNNDDVHDRRLLLNDDFYLNDYENGVATDLYSSNSPHPGGGGGGGMRLRIPSNVARRVGHVFAFVTFLAISIIVPYVTIQAVRDKTVRTDRAAFFSAGTFVLITVVLSTRQIYTHLTNWYMPDVQKYVVRILWMVPVYAVQSWLSLRFHDARIYIDTFRDLYEAYVIQSFVYYLVELLGGEEQLVLILRNKDESLGEHVSVFGYFLSPWEMGMEFMLQCKHGVLQYVVVKTVATFFTAVLEPFDLYGEGEFSWRKGYPYISFVMNLSVMYALYCLVKLFHATRDELRKPVNWHPVGKFLCVKGVVFFTWWQSVAIFFLRANGIVGDMGTWDADDVAHGLQDYLVCVEMFFFAIAHSYTFTYEEYLPKPPSMMAAGVGASQKSSGDRGGRGGFFGGLGRFFRRGGGDKPKQARSSPDGVDYDQVVSDEDDPAYQPPVIRTLHAPMGFSEAFWSSTLPNETLSDIKRLRNGVSEKVVNESSNTGMISMASIQHAESI